MHVTPFTLHTERSDTAWAEKPELPVPLSSVVQAAGRAPPALHARRTQLPPRWLASQHRKENKINWSPSIPASWLGTGADECVADNAPSM